MRVRLKKDLVAIVPESPEDVSVLSRWAAHRKDHVFVLAVEGSQACRLIDLGKRDEACRKPINITSRSTDEGHRLISNLAHTPFNLDGRDFASIEGFWQGLKFPDEAVRRFTAGLHGHEARLAGASAEEHHSFVYQSQHVRVGTWDHWKLMERACEAKFQQHAEAQAALLATGNRPLTHKTGRDSHNIPAVIMADIWMSIRDRLRKEHPSKNASLTTSYA